MSHLAWQCRLRVPGLGVGGGALLPTGWSPFPGIAYVELDSPEETRVGLALSDEEADRMQPTSGTILASGDPRYKAGEHALCFLFWGQQIFVDFTQGDWVAENQVRACGVSVISAAFRLTERTPLHHVIPAVIDESTLRVMGDWVLIGRKKAPVESGGILLPSSMVTGCCKGTVLGFGEMVSDLCVGDEVQYAAGSVVNGYAPVLDPHGRLAYDAEDLILVRYSNLLCKFAP